MKEQPKPPRESDIDIESFARRKEGELKQYIIEHQLRKLIYTNEDELSNCLAKHLNRVEGRRSWFTPLGILITIVVVFATSTFRFALGLSSDTWRVIFITIGGVTCIWLIWSIIRACKSKGIENIIKDIVAELKGHLTGPG